MPDIEMFPVWLPMPTYLILVYINSMLQYYPIHLFPPSKHTTYIFEIQKRNFTKRQILHLTTKFIHRRIQPQANGGGAININFSENGYVFGRTNLCNFSHQKWKRQPPR
jgi:hypothetical protein